MNENNCGRSNEERRKSPILLIGSWKTFPNKAGKSKGKVNRSAVNVLLETPNSLKFHQPAGDKTRPLLPNTCSKLRSGINIRYHDLGLPKKCLEKSFETNQSFSGQTAYDKWCRSRYDYIDLPNLIHKINTRLDGMDKIRVDGANGLRFTPRTKATPFTPISTGSPYNSSLAPVGSQSTISDAALLRIPKNGINPNKAVFTINSKTSKILIVNNNACQLLGYTSKELCDMRFAHLLTNKDKNHVSALAEGQLNSEDGTMVLLSGKVVEMTTKSNARIAVSLWIRQIDTDGRCLAVAEPVERRIAQITIDRTGHIVSVDNEAVLLFQLDSFDRLNGLDIQSLIPAIRLPDSDSSILSKSVRKQKATGKTIDGIAFPLCLKLSMQESGTDTTDSGVSNSGSNLYVIQIWVFQNVSGLLVIDQNGFIESCNHHFSMLMFGYSQTNIIGLHITKIIPNFGQELEYLGLTRSRNHTESSLDNDESETETDPVYVDAEYDPIDTATNAMSRSTVLDDRLKMQQRTCLSKSLSDHFKENFENNRNLANLNRTILYFNRPVSEHIDRIYDTDLLTPVNEDIVDDKYGTTTSITSGSEHLNTNDLSDVIKQIDVTSNDRTADSQTSKHDVRKSLITSTPDVRRFSMPLAQAPYVPIGQAIAQSAPSGSHLKQTYSDGKYKGEAIHSDGNVIDIIYTISLQILPCGRRVFCVWISRDPDIPYDDDDKHQNLTLTFNSIASTIETSAGPASHHRPQIASNVIGSRPNSVSLLSQCEDEQIGGDYSKHYTTLKQIGKGAYGYVKMAFRHTDRLLVITKFILKEKLTPHVMVQTEDKREVPMEIYLLTTVKHPNIVSVLDVFENEKFFQLVMEKHGSGMDLFEFIDRRPDMDEPLASFIFRQIANAVNYLHSLRILHRDIKDENIIIDQNFQVKLIDFGSATFMEDGKLFSTFYGTTEYCSPEVLAGNKYAGPELEMWSLGVTLYVIVFFENPFLDIEETLQAELCLPASVSPTLSRLLYTMLDKDPRTRCTMKQLMADEWINQSVNSDIFDFAYTVPCEPFEAQPDIFYNGQVLSSATALSTTSQQDSLSLADDEDSIIDVDDGEDFNDDGDIENQLPRDFDDKSIRNQIDGPCEKCGHLTDPVHKKIDIGSPGSIGDQQIVSPDCATTHTGSSYQITSISVANNDYPDDWEEYSGDDDDDSFS